MSEPKAVTRDAFQCAAETRAARGETGQQDSSHIQTQRADAEEATIEVVPHDNSGI